jgi:hypothetical protein
MPKAELSHPKDKPQSPPYPTDLDPKSLAAALANAYAMAAEDRATISALQDIVAKQAVEIAALRAGSSCPSGREGAA